MSVVRVSVHAFVPSEFGQEGKEHIACPKTYAHHCTMQLLPNLTNHLNQKDGVKKFNLHLSWAGARKFYKVNENWK